MKDLTLLKEGELKAIHGNARFAYYLGVEPTGIYSAVKLDNGTKTLEEMKKEPYLYVVSFSDFSMDSLSGYFGGEIRLAYLFDGEKEVLSAVISWNYRKIWHFPPSVIKIKIMTDHLRSNFMG